ncbi:MAG: hypothetical protein AAF970_08930 [Bacteroidota bacterium]
MTSTPYRRAGLLAGLNLIALLLALPAQAQTGVTVRVGTFGPGLEVSQAFGSQLSLRAGASLFRYSRNDVLQDEVDVEVSTDAQVGAGNLVLDWHPFKNGFRLSTGVYYNAFGVESQIVPIESYTIDDREFAPERLGSLTAELDYGSKFSPYLGLGLGHPARGKRVGLLFDLGVLYAGSPTLNLEGEGMIGPTANHEATLNEGIESFQFYPVMSLGLSVRL